jgi:lysozyme
MRDEGFRSQAYKCTANRLTIGYGRNIEDVGITEEEAEHLLYNDVARVEHQLDKTYPWWVKCPGSVRRALVNMTFNLGIHRLGEFKKMLACLQAGDYRGASVAALDSKWATQVGDRAVRVAELIAEAKGD